MARWGARIGMTGLVVLAAGCGSSPAPTVAPGGYLTSNGKEVGFIQLHGGSKDLSGTLDSLSALDSAHPYQLTPEHTSISGQESGDAVTLTTGVGKTLIGTRQGTGLLMQLPVADGTLETLRFAPATVAAYDAAVARLRSHVATLQAAATAQQAKVAQAQAQAAAAAQAAAQQQQAITAAAASTSSDLGTLVTDREALAKITPFVTVLAAVSADVHVERQALGVESAAERSHPKSPPAPSTTTSASCATVSAGLVAVQSADGDVARDAGVVNAQVTQVNNGVTQVNTDITNLKTDEAALVAAMAADPTGTVAPSDPTAAHVASVLQRAGDQVTSSLGALAAAQSDNTADLSQAASLLQQAEALLTSCQTS